MSLLSDLLFRSPFVDLRTGLVTRPWQQWLLSLTARTGGVGDVASNTDLETMIVQVSTSGGDTVSSAAMGAAPDELMGIVNQLTMPPPILQGGIVDDLSWTMPQTATLADLPDLTAAMLSAAQVRALLDEITSDIPPLPLPSPRGHLYGGPLASPAVARTAAGAGTNATVSIAGTDTAGTITLNTSAADTPSANSTILTVTFQQPYAAAPIVQVMPSNDAAWALAYAIVRCRQADVTTALFTLRSGGTPLPATTAATYTYNYCVIGS